MPAITLPSRGTLLCLLICSGLVLSSVIPIPLPRGWVQQRLEDLALEGREGSVVLSRVTLRWGTGTLRISDLEVVDKAGLRFAADGFTVQVGIFPLADDFLKVRGVHIQRPDITMEPSWLENMRAAAGPATQVPRLPVVMKDGAIHWRDTEEGTSLSARFQTLDGLIEGKQSAFSGVVEPPWGGRLRFALRSLDDWNRWEMELESNARNVEMQPGMPLGLEGLRAESLSLRAHLEGSGTHVPVAQIDLELRNVVGVLPVLGAKCEQLSLEAKGDLSSGLNLLVSGVFQDGSLPPIPVQAKGFLHNREDNRLRLRLEGDVGPVLLDAELIESLREMDPGAAEALDGFEPRGPAAARFLVDWTEQEDPLWAIRANPDGPFSIAYRGFPEASGEQPAFAYPITEVEGELSISGDRMLLSLGGRMGAGRMDSLTALRLGVGHAQIASDAVIRDLWLDERVAEYAEGTPDLADVLYDLGGLDGGSCELFFTVRREYMSDDLELEIRGTVLNTNVRPDFLPVPSVIERLDFRWTPGAADFAGTARSMGGTVELQGRVRSVAAAESSSVMVEATARNLRPVHDDRRVLERYLEMPTGAAEFEMSGDNTVHLYFRRPGGADDAQVLVEWSARDMDMNWEKEQLRFQLNAVDLTVFRAQDQTAISLSLAELTVEDNPVTLSVYSFQDGAEGRSRALFAVPRLKITESMARRVLVDAFDVPEILERFDFAGEVGGMLVADPSGSEGMRGILILRPVEVTSRSGAGTKASLRGLFRFEAGSLRSPRLTVASDAGELVLRDLAVTPSASGTKITTRIESVGGLEIMRVLPSLTSSADWQALRRLGVSGEISFDPLLVSYDIALDGTTQLDLDGRILLRNMRLEGPPTIRAGSADLAIKSFRWNGPEDFQGQLRLENGDALLGGVQSREANGNLEVTPDEIVLRNFRTRTLGGYLTTDGLNEDGEEERGYLKLGLTPEAPIEILVFLESLSMARMRKELSLGGSLAGEVWGRMDFHSATPSPLDYTGRGVLEIRNGVLGTVPVLADVWSFAGVSPPLFNEGRVVWNASAEHARGIIRIEELTLDSPWLTVNAEGWVGYDGYLQLKATVRTLSIFGQLPIIGNVMDLFMRQNIRGPFDNPVINQRAFDELSGEDPRHPFPLWEPDVPRGDWRRSPALPVEGQ